MTKLQSGLVFKSHLGIVGWSEVRLAEVDFHENMGYFIKIDGQSNQTGKTEQVQIWFNEFDTADLIALLIKLMRKRGGPSIETLNRFLVTSHKNAKKLRDILHYPPITEKIDDQVIIELDGFLEELIDPGESSLEVNDKHDK